MVAAAQSNKSPTTHVMSVARFGRFLRIAAGLNADKQDLKRYSDFINQKGNDLLLPAEATRRQTAGADFRSADVASLKKSVSSRWDRRRSPSLVAAFVVEPRRRR
jgi:hypothetical protein